MNTVLQYVLYLVILVALAVPLGFYIKRVMEGEKTFISRILTPCEKGVYKLMRIKSDEQMTWKKYLVSVLIFSGIGFLFVFLLQLLQGFLPGNPQDSPEYRGTYPLTLLLVLLPIQTGRHTPVSQL